MKQTRTPFKPVIPVLFFFLFGINGHAQVEGKDVLKDNYIIGHSDEIFTIRVEDDTIEFRIFDADGNINDNGIVEKDRKYILDNEWQAFNYASPVTLLSGDFDGDKYTDVVAAWEAGDTNIALYMPHIDPQTLKITSEYKAHLIESGMPKMYHFSGSLPRLISLKKGQLDTDREDEIVLAYMTDKEDSEGGPVLIAIYDIDPSSGLPLLKDTLSTVMLRPELYNANNGISRGSLFDVCTGDFNQDGIDEIVLAAVNEYPDGDEWGWRLDVLMYQMQDGKLKFLNKTTDPLYIDNANSSDYIKRLAVVAGNFDNDFVEDIAVSYQVVETGNGDSEIFLRALKATTDSFGIMGSQNKIDGSNGNNGWPVCMRAEDADRDGFDEVQLEVRNTLASYSFDENMNQVSKPSPVFAYGLNMDKPDAFTSTFQATDMDLAENDSLKMEIAVIDSRGLLVFQKINSKGSFEILDEVDFKAGGVATGDFDGDALRLGPPRSQTITNIVQPLLVLSSPPVHFDIFDGEVFDLQDCYPVYEASENCETSSVYYAKTEEHEIESSVEVSSTWTKTDLPINEIFPGQYSPDYAEIADRLINMELNKIYGGGDVERKRSSQTYTFTSRSETTEDDNIQCLVTEYQLQEFPVYVEDSVVGYVLAVDPSRNSSKTKLQWIPFRNNAARNFHPNHEVGNILSYPKTTDLPPGARPFGTGGYDGGLVTWTVSPSSVGNWNMKFSSETIEERESTSTQTISNDISGSAGFSFVAEASVNFEYLDNKTYEEISSVKTTIKESSEINISIGKINTGLIGTKTYDITPFMYWDASGSLVLDYAVSPDYSGGIPSWWEEHYGQFPDLTFNLPWRYSGSRGLGGSDDDLQSKQTYDIVLSRLDAKAGDTASIYARIQNYSNVDVFGNVFVRFYLGDPDNGGLLIENTDGKSEVVLEQISAREPVMARLDNWVVPASIDDETKIFAVIDPDNHIDEVHEDNNKAWNLAKQGFGSPVSVEDFEADRINSDKDNRIHLVPNPMEDKAIFFYDLAEATQVKIEIYDMQGDLIRTVTDQHRTAGKHTLEFDTGGLGQGIYLYHFVAGKYSESGKMVVIH